MQYLSYMQITSTHVIGVHIYPPSSKYAGISPKKAKKLLNFLLQQQRANATNEKLSQQICVNDRETSTDCSIGCLSAKSDKLCWSLWTRPDKNIQNWICRLTKTNWNCCINCWHAYVNDNSHPFIIALKAKCSNIATKIEFVICPMTHRFGSIMLEFKENCENNCINQYKINQNSNTSCSPRL